MKRKAVDLEAFSQDIAEIERKDAKVAKSKEVCSICLDHIKKTPVPCKPLDTKQKPCSAFFCDGCLKQWVERKTGDNGDGTDGTCPNCRTVIAKCPPRNRVHIITSLDDMRRVNQAGSGETDPSVQQLLQLLYMDVAAFNHEVRGRPLPRIAGAPSANTVPSAIVEEPDLRPADRQWFHCQVCRGAQHQRRFRFLHEIVAHIAENHPRVSLFKKNHETAQIVCAQHPHEPIPLTRQGLILHFSGNGHCMNELEKRIGAPIL